MFRNFLVIAWRNLLRKKTFSFLNIAGLSIGMAAAVLILLWVQFEMGYDRFFNDQDRIYKVYNRYAQEGRVNCWAATPKPMAAAISNDYAEVEQACRVSFMPPVQFTIDDRRVYSRGNMVDSNFLRIFSFPVVKSDGGKPFKDAYSIVLTEKLAKDMFGDENPIGKTVKMDTADNFIVTAVVKDKPANTSFDFQFLVSSAFGRLKGWDDDFWGNNSLETYVKLKANSSLASIEPRIKTLRKKYDTEDPKIETFLYPLSKVYLYDKFENGVPSGGRIELVRLFLIIAAFILLIACINFMNLSTARSEKRAREVGVRKVVGAAKGSLVVQFLGESIFISLLSGIFAFLLIKLSLPYFNELVDKKLSIPIDRYEFWLASFGFILLTGLLAGSYPALYLSSFKPVKVLKGIVKNGNALVTPRKVLVITQFSFAILLIIATIVVRQQIKTAQDRQVGYSKDNLVYHFMEGQVERNYTVIKQELLSSGIAESVTKTSAPITEGWSNTWGIEWPGKDPQSRDVIDRFVADDQFVKTAGLQLVAGRDLDITKYPTDSSAALINESAVKLMKFKEPLGQIVKDMGRDWHIVGVVKDFILTSPYKPTDPMFIAGANGWFNVIHIKLNKNKPMTENISAMSAIFKKYNPEYEFNYRFVDEEYGKKFESEKRAGSLATVFSVLTIVISCLGLFGLASYMAENRLKEIGVRKVLGASVAGITRLLSTEFLKLVGISFLIAAPLGFWAMYKWLQQFPYRTELSWWIFALAGVLALLIAILTVGFQALKAANTNPVKTLRSE